MAQLLNLLDRLQNKRILVVGDLGVDDYVSGDVKRISPEAPVPVLEVNKEDRRIGLSGNVAQNIVSLGGRADLLSVIGHDGAGEGIVSLLKQAGVGTEFLITDSSRPTTRKMRVMTGHHHIVRVDFELKRFLSKEIEARVLTSFEQALKLVDAVILQDYAKGVVSESLAQKIIDKSNQNKVPVLVDPHRAAPLKIYRGAKVFKPNFDEAVALSGLPAESLHQNGDFIQQVGRFLRDELNVENVVLTRGKEGMSVFAQDRVTHVPTVAKEVYDVTGAGDTVIAALALAYAAGISIEDSCRIANFAAGIVVAKVGCVPCPMAELRSTIAEVEKL